MRANPFKEKPPTRVDGRRRTPVGRRPLDDDNYSDVENRSEDRDHDAHKTNLPVVETHLSPQAHQRLVAELGERSGPTRLQISEWIERAREMGDLKENGDYHAAKNEQGLNEARVRQLEAILKSAVIVEAASAEKVEAGTVVEVRMEGDEETSSYLVGSIEERGSAYDVISPGSPLGKVLLGGVPGDVVSYEAPGGRFDVTIVAVRPPD